MKVNQSKGIMMRKKKKLEESLAKTETNFPKLEKKTKKSTQQQSKGNSNYQGKIRETFSDHSEAHKIYLAQKAQDYKKELELILNSSKHAVLPGREYCENYDP